MHTRLLNLSKCTVANYTIPILNRYQINIKSPGLPEMKIFCLRWGEPEFIKKKKKPYHWKYKRIIQGGVFCQANVIYRRKIISHWFIQHTLEVCFWTSMVLLLPVGKADAIHIFRKCPMIAAMNQRYPGLEMSCLKAMKYASHTPLRLASFLIPMGFTLYSEGLMALIIL